MEWLFDRINPNMLASNTNTFIKVVAAAYPELVSMGVSERRKCKWLVRVGAPVTVSPPD